MPRVGLGVGSSLVGPLHFAGQFYHESYKPYTAFSALPAASGGRIMTGAMDDLVSIIIPTRNRAKYLRRALESVVPEIESDYSHCEIIVIDGGSTDETVDVIQGFKPYIRHWVSEPDNGVGDAINKGLDAARGSYIRFLGDDDEIIVGSTRKMAEYLNNFAFVQTVFGHGELLNEDGDGVRSPIHAPQPIGALLTREFLNMARIGWVAPEMQMTRRQVFERFGGYDCKYHYLGCFDMWLRHASRGVFSEVRPFVVAKKIFTPVSDNNTAQLALQREYYAILYRYGGLRSVFKNENPIRVFCRYFGIRPRYAIKRLIHNRQFIGHASD